MSGQVLDRPDERVPLEQPSLFPQEPVELGAVDSAEPAPEDELLRRRDGRDGVHLEEAEAPDRLQDAPRRPVEELRANCNPPRVLPRDLDQPHPLRTSQLPPSPARVLEVGCGAGDLARALSAEGYSVLAIDPDAPEEPIFRRTTIEALDDPGPFDAVVASLSLHHVEDLGGVLDKLLRLLEGPLILNEHAGTGSSR